MERSLESNQVVIRGEISEEFSFSHEMFGEKFYTTYVSVLRLSRGCDLIPIMVSERLVSVNNAWTGQIVRVSGQLRSYNKRGENKCRLKLSVFARKFEVWSRDDYIRSENEIIIDGYICKAPTYRWTPLGREITDVLLAVNRSYGKTDYIPCICWGRNANYVASVMEVGKRIRVAGRIQSREYKKRMDEEQTETRVAYEVSVSRLVEINTVSQGDRDE